MIGKSGVYKLKVIKKSIAEDLPDYSNLALKLESEERKNLLKELIASYSYYWFFGESESKEVIEKNYKIKPNLNNKKVQ